MSAVAGTEALGRPFTDAEKKHFATLLREHDYPGAHLVALRFAHKLTRDPQASRDLASRAEQRLLRHGWDPAKVSLAKALCRFVWSEWTHSIEETASVRKAEEAFVTEMHAETAARNAFPEAPDARIRAGEERQRAQARIERLRGLFERAGDEVNLAWLEYSLQEIDDLGEMARLSQRDVREFYRAADRRKRHVEHLLAEEKGVTLEEGE